MHPVRYSVLVLAGLMMAMPVFAQSPNDPLLSKQWPLAQIQALDAWDTTTGSRSVVVAVLDTGIDVDHPDLAENIWTNPGEIPGDGIDNDQNGFVDDLHGWDFVDGDNNAVPELDGGENDPGAVTHGTVIAGVIGAVGNNNEGIAGVNWQVQIMPVRMLGAFGNGNSFHARQAVEYAVANGADIINLSFTGFDVDPDFAQSIQDAYAAGVLVVASLGNQEDGGLNVDEKPIYPACFKSADEREDWVIGVVATDQSDKKAMFSNYGATCADLSAPGQDIFSTKFLDGSPGFTEAYAGGWDGTSIAAPFVAGTAALLKAKYPTLSPRQLKTVMQLSVDPVAESGFANGKIGAGRINVARALSIAGGFAPAAADPGGSATPLPGPSVPAPASTSVGHVIAVGSAQGAEPWVRVFDTSGTLKASFLAYDAGFRGGVRLALGDVDGDGIPEIVTVPGPGGGPHVRVFELDGTVASQFFAFETSMHTGLFVAVGDTDLDDIDEIAVTQDEGGTGLMKLFNRSGSLLDLHQPFGPTSRSLRMAIGDVDGDRDGDYLFSLGKGERPVVLVTSTTGAKIGEFLAYAETYDRGVFVATSDVDGDGKDEIVTGTDNGGGPHVRVFEPDGSVRNQFFAYDTAFRGGVRLAATRNGVIATAAGPGGGPHIRLFTESGGVTGGFFSTDTSTRTGIYLAIY